MDESDRGKGRSVESENESTDDSKSDEGAVEVKTASESNDESHNEPDPESQSTSESGQESRESPDDSETGDDQTEETEEETPESSVHALQESIADIEHYMEQVDSRLDDIEEQVQSVEDLESSIEDHGSRISDLESGLEDHRRRSQKEREEIREYAVEQFAEEMIRVKDSLDTAIEVEELDESVEERFELLNREFEQALERGNVSTIDDSSEEFDSLRHKIVDKAQSEDHESNEIVEIREPGYEMSGRVLRPARVVLAI